MSFFKDYIMPFLETESKDYNKVVDNYIFIYDIITSNYNMQDIFTDYKKNKYLNRIERAKCKNIFYSHMQMGSDYALICSNLLSDKPSSKDVRVAISLFKKVYKKDVLLSVNLLKIIDNAGKNIDRFLRGFINKCGASMHTFLVV